MWIQPGGHVDKDEEPIDAARRETFEETGLLLDFKDQIFHLDVHNAGDHVHYDIRYLAFSESLALSPGANESQSVAWFTPAALSIVTDPALKGCINKILEHI